MMTKKLSIILLFVLLSGSIYAQDFGFDDTWGSVSEPALSVKVSGELAAAFTGYVHDFSSEEKTKAASLGDVVSGALNFSASGANVNAIIGLSLSAANINDLANSNTGSPIYTPLILDEAYLRTYFGPVNIEAGLRKLSWGKADSLGPLDIINPLDYTDLRNITDLQAIKIARPMIHATWNTDGFSKLEAVFIPNFAGHRFAQEGRWASSQFKDMPSVAEKGIASRVAEKYGTFISMPGSDVLLDGVKSNLLAHLDSNSLSFPATGGLEYVQAGLRYTTTIGPADIGAQYVYGNLFRPDFTIAGVDNFFDDLIAVNTSAIMTGNTPDYLGDPGLLSPQIKYSRYHQIGIDYAQVLFDFNVRSEFAVYLTEDMKGNDGTVHNPFIGWSLGFDRNLFWGINANVQCNETIRLLNDKIGNNPILDSEADTNAVSTRLTMHLSKKFLMDNLETKITAIWDIENSDCYIIPTLAWTVGDVSAELSAGVFAGKKSGELGQYWENSFIKLGLKYAF